jgi:hypothetical protein
MNDDVDPAVTDALHRLADSAPQPRQDRLQAVVAGVHRRQRRVVGASALSVVALIAATALGLQSWRHTAVSVPAPTGSSDHATTSGPADSLGGFPVSPSPTLTGSPIQPSPTPSVSARHTPSLTGQNSPGPGHIDPRVNFQVSPTLAVAGQQVHVTVTILNPGTAYDETGRLALGTSVPVDTFDEVPPACAPQLGGVECTTNGLGPGQKASFSFIVTLKWSPMGWDAIFGTLDYVDGHGQPQQATFNQQVTVVESTPTPSPSASGVPSSTPPTSVSGTATPTPSAAGTPTGASATPTP